MHIYEPVNNSHSNLMVKMSQYNCGATVSNFQPAFTASLLLYANLHENNLGQRIERLFQRKWLFQNAFNNKRFMNDGHFSLLLFFGHVLFVTQLMQVMMTQL